MRSRGIDTVVNGMHWDIGHSWFPPGCSGGKDGDISVNDFREQHIGEE